MKKGANSGPSVKGAVSGPVKGHTSLSSRVGNGVVRMDGPFEGPNVFFTGKSGIVRKIEVTK